MKKKIIYLSFILVLVISLITLSSIYKSKDNKYNKHNTISKDMAIMIKEEGATDYVRSNSKDIPKGNYVLNEEKTHCENNGKVTNYNNSSGTISINFIGSDKCYLYFDYKKETIKLGSAVLEVNSETPDFSKVATTNEGLFKAQDDLGTSYYFRGAVDNNWVKFGKDSSGKDIYWRIIRINGDGSIRMIYTGTTAPTESTKVVMTGTGTQIGTSAFNSSTDKAEYVGYMYQLGQQHGNKNSTSSAIKTTIDNWYKTTTLETDLKTKSLVVDQIFCNDRTASTSNVTYSTTNYTTLTSWNSTETDYKYGAYGRLDDFNSNRTPILICPTASDKFTVNTSNGNGALTYPVGLITADEIAMAGGVKESANSSYYLYTNQHYWSGTPESFYSGGDAFEYSVYPSGANNGYTVYYIRYGARPVISLSSKAKLTGDGTYNDVYTVVGDNSTENTSSGKSFDTVFAANNTDIFNEKGIRYEGADPNNYICLDNKTGGACSSSSLLFRIIGLFDEDTSSDGTNSSGTKKLLKVIDTNNYGGTEGKYWNSAGTNNWSSASLKTELNGTYLTTLLGISNVNSKLSSGVANAKWYLGGVNSYSESGNSYYYKTITTESVYKAERPPYYTFLNLSENIFQNLYSGNPEYVFTKVGLMYPSDYGYATVGGSTTNKARCRASELYNWGNSSYSDCKNNDWIFKSATFVNSGEWLISPEASASRFASYLYSNGSLRISYSVDAGQLAIRPTIYLDSSVLKIVGTGDGTSSNPYRIG